MGTKASTVRFVSEMCRTSYYQFFREFWSLIAAEKLVDSWYIRKYCDELQVVAERVFADKPKDYDFITNCPPGSSKSSAFSVAYQPWIWTRMPSARVISGSHSERLSLDLSRKSRDIVMSEKYQELFPEIQLREDQNTKGYFVNSKGGIRYAVGVGGSVIGMHAHFIIIDDPIDPQAAMSDLMMAEANIWMTETLSQRKVDKLLTPTVLVMQRLHQNDPTGNMLDSGRKIRHLCLPCDASWEIKPPSLKEFYEGGLFDPVRFPQPVLDEALTTLLEVGYAGQYGQSPIPRGGALFVVDELQYQSHPPQKWKRGPVRFWDKASTSGGGAFTVGAKLAMDQGDRVWILDIIRGQWDSGRREDKIIETAKLDGKHVRVGVEQEPGGSGKESAENTARRLAFLGFRCLLDKVTGDKELRADPLSTFVNTGKVILLLAPWNKTLTEEMRYFPRSKYKDQVDSISGGFNMLHKSRVRIGAL